MWFLALLLLADSSEKEDKEKQAKQALRKQILASMPPIPVTKEEAEAARLVANAQYEARQRQSRQSMLVLALAGILTIITMALYELIAR